MRILIFTFFLFFAGGLHARPTRIATLYSTSNQLGKFAFGLEASCMTRAVLEDARKNGLDITVEDFDLEYNPIRAGAVAKEVAKKGYDVAIGTLTSGEAIASAPVFEREKIPFVVPTASNPSVTRNRRYVTRIAFNDFRQAKLLASLTASELRPKRVAIIRNVSNRYSDFLGKEYFRELGQQSPQVSIKDYPIINGFEENSALISEILSYKADLIFVPVLQSTVSSFYSELARRKVKITLLGSDIVESDVNFTETLGRTSPNIRFIFVQHWNRRYEGPYGSKFRHLLRSRCSNYRPSMVLAASFDASMLLVTALKRLGKFSKEALIPEMRRVPFVGVTGPIAYGFDGDPVKPLQLFKLEQNHTIFWKEYQ